LLRIDVGFDSIQYESDDYYTMVRPSLPDIILEWGYRWRLLLRTYIRPMCASGRLLDVGAGNGLFVKIARDEFGYEAVGLETSEKQVEFARTVVGVELLHGDVSSVGGMYDVVTCFNVIEHVPCPLSLLSQLSARVADAGTLVLTTPNPRAIQARLKGLERWNMLAPPHHLQIFSKSALAVALESVGFEIRRYSTLSSYIRVLRRIEGRKTILRHAVSRSLALLGMGADHVVIAKRKPS
jgi:2-polyprenyl-3-methyl-5-hydroxy-6-metoxy-1,4-benzoquinol methylase